MSTRNMNTYNLNELSDGERLWVERKFSTRITQYEAAQHMEVSHTLYVDMELDRRPVMRFLVPSRRILYTPAKLALARRRSGHTLVWLAMRLGLSHQGYLNKERGGDSRLVGYWKGRGYKF